VILVINYEERIGQAVILVINYEETFKTDVIVFICDVIMSLTSHLPIIFSIRAGTTFSTQDTGRRPTKHQNTTQKTKKMSNTYHIKNLGVKTNRTSKHILVQLLSMYLV
jgi:hypothetical protein